MEDKASIDNKQSTPISRGAAVGGTHGPIFKKYKKRTPSPSISVAQQTPLAPNRGVSTPTAKRQRKASTSAPLASTNRGEQGAFPRRRCVQERRLCGAADGRRESAKGLRDAAQTRVQKDAATPESSDSAIEAREEIQAPKLDTSREYSFLREALSKPQSPQLWFDLLSKIAHMPSISLEHMNGALKFAIGLLHMSDEPFLGRQDFKSLAKFDLSSILLETDLASQQQLLKHFISSYRTAMEAAGAASDSEINSTLTAKASTDTDLNSTEHSQGAQDTTFNKPCPYPSLTQPVTIEPLSSEIAMESNVQCDGAVEPEDVNATSSAPDLAFPSLARSLEMLLRTGHSTESDTSNALSTSTVEWGLQVSHSVSEPLNRSKAPTHDALFAQEMNRMHGSSISSGLDVLRASERTHERSFESDTNLSLPANNPQAMTLSGQHPVLGVLPMPETTLHFPNKLIPPKYPSRAHSSGASQRQMSLKTVLDKTNDAGTSTCNRAWTAAAPLALTQATLLISGQKQFLVIPNQLQGNGLSQLAGKDIEQVVKEGAAIPLSIDHQGLATKPGEDRHVTSRRLASGTDDRELEQTTTNRRLPSPWMPPISSRNHRVGTPQRQTGRKSASRELEKERSDGLHVS